MAFDWAVRHGQAVGSALVLVVAVVLGLWRRYDLSIEGDEAMSWRYGRFTAPSDRDYDADGDGAAPVTVTCVQCGQAYETEADDRPPYRCEACLTRQRPAQRCTGAA